MPLAAGGRLLHLGRSHFRGRRVAGQHEHVAPAGPHDLGPLDDLVPLIVHELRAMAHRQLAGEHNVVTLQTTDLVHEVYLRLRANPAVTRLGRPYFYGAAAQAMRRVLVDAARRRRARRRDVTVPLEQAPEPAVDAFSLELMALDEALARLAAAHPRQAQVVECRYFGGLSVEDTAAALGVSPRTVKSDWAEARAWLWRALHGDGA